jgi:hypothetical protein
MNIALSSVIIFILFLPGLIFRRFYYTEEFSKQYFKEGAFEIFVSCFVPSIALHFATIFLVNLFGYSVDLTIIGQLVTSKDYPKEAFENIQSNYYNISWYHLISILLAVILGYFSKKIVRVAKLDRSFQLFRFKNSWHYIFSGELFDFPRAAYDLERDRVEDIELVYVDVLVECKEGSIIYDGILVDYELSKDGGLDYLVIKESERRFLKDDSAADEPEDENVEGANVDINEIELMDDPRHYQIPGHILVVPSSKILNFNLSYYKFELLADGTYDVTLLE